MNAKPGTHPPLRDFPVAVRRMLVIGSACVILARTAHSSELVMPLETGNRWTYRVEHWDTSQYTKTSNSWMISRSIGIESESRLHDSSFFTVVYRDSVYNRQADFPSDTGRVNLRPEDSVAIGSFTVPAMPAGEKSFFDDFFGVLFRNTAYPGTVLRTEPDTIGGLVKEANAAWEGTRNGTSTLQTYNYKVVSGIGVMEYKYHFSDYNSLYQGAGTTAELVGFTSRGLTLADIPRLPIPAYRRRPSALPGQVPWKSSNFDLSGRRRSWPARPAKG
jgi:hypothetical protein